MSSIRVALVDDHPVVLAGVAALLESAPDVTLVGQASTAAEALVMIALVLPDVAIIDLSLPDSSGLSLAQRLADAHPSVKLIALTVHESRAYVQPLLLAGARGYVLKRSAGDDLIRALRAVANGGLYLDPAVAGQAFPDAPPEISGEVASEAQQDLSPREEAVLRLTARGFSNKEIAARIEISVKSVETYKARAAAKGSLRSRAEIVRYGVARGWLDSIDTS